ncbi:septal ring lytic transglycosylase RlpA family protein [Sphingomonas sp.]|uniref:septal ring lytic transglycosylase RlpA family protein n=1 Tax=Sphingomonas sp. TaxID=28214 RepID=UPI003B00B621
MADAPVRLGRPYAVGGRTYVPYDDSRYDTIGEASWYGTREQGRPTANGERFDRRRVSAAHPTLPLPSYVEVTRLDTGQRMIVRVNDRGPFARDRILDLSREAAHELDIDRAGRALVRVRRVTPTSGQAKALRRGYPIMLASVRATASPPGVGPVPASPRPLPRAPVATPPLAVPPSRPQDVIATSGYWIVVATPADPDAADALASVLAGEGGRVEPSGGGYRVLTGPYVDAVARADALARLASRGYQGAVALDAPGLIANGTTLP